MLPARRLAIVVMLGLLAGSCSSEPSLTDYAGELEALVTTMNARLDEIDVIFRAPGASLEEIRRYAEDRMVARRTFLAGFEGLEPPSEAEDVHQAGLEIIRTLVAAEQEVADLAFASDDLTTVAGLWDSPTGQAARAADVQAVALCLAAEEALNSTQERQQLAGVPWVPSELQEVVTVAFGCIAAER